MAVNIVVRAPRQRHKVRAVWLFSMRGLSRIRRKMPATTMVLEWSKAETGVGPSMAAGSQGWSPNCADFPVAAKIRPRRGRVISRFLLRADICWISQVLMLVASQAMLRINPISPTRL